MNYCPGGRPPLLWLARAAAVMTAMTTAGLLAAACSDGPSSGGSGGTPGAGVSATSAAAVAYTSCMRSHGVPDYPDPNSQGQLPKIGPGEEAQLGVSDSRFTSAGTACQQLWPYQGPTQAEQRQQLTDDLKFAQCMRAHGVPDFPDPTTGPGGRVEFVLTPSQEPMTQSPVIIAKAHACEHVLPAGSGLPEVATSP